MQLHSSPCASGSLKLACEEFRAKQAGQLEDAKKSTRRSASQCIWQLRGHPDEFVVADQVCNIAEGIQLQGRPSKCIPVKASPGAYPEQQPNMKQAGQLVGAPRCAAAHYICHQPQARLRVHPEELVKVEGAGQLRDAEQSSCRSAPKVHLTSSKPRGFVPSKAGRIPGLGPTMNVLTSTPTVHFASLKLTQKTWSK